MGVGVSSRDDARLRPATMPSSGLRFAGFDSPLLILGCRRRSRARRGASIRVSIGPLGRRGALGQHRRSCRCGRIPEALRHDGAPPLYYFLLHGWMEIFGTGNASVRALSGVLGTLTLDPDVVRRSASRSSGGSARGDAAVGSRPVVAWSAALLLALSPFAIRYSTEPRMYALVMLLGSARVPRARPGVRTPVRRPARRRRRRDRAAPVHPLLGVPAPRGRRRAWSMVRVWRGDAGAAPHRGQAARSRSESACSTFLPWVPTFLFQLRHTGTPWGAPVSPFGSWATAFKSFGGNAHLAGWLLVALVLLGLFAARGRRAATSRSTWPPGPASGSRPRRGRHPRARAGGRAALRDHVRGSLRVRGVPAVPARRRVRSHGVRRPADPDRRVGGARWSWARGAG